MDNMKRRILSAAAAAAVAGLLGLGGANAQDAIKVGVVGPKTGPLAGGAAITHFPNFRLWQKLVNDRGGLKLKTGQRKIELIEYDDRTQPPETIKAVERLVNVDKADLIMPVYGTGFNLAVAPIFAKYNYPLLGQAFVTDQGPELIKRYPNLFIFQGSTQQFARDAANTLKKLRDEGKIGNKVAIVNVADAFGIELANAGRPIFEKAGFQIVYDKSYPLGTQDLSPVVKAAKAANPDAFVAWSYPPDTMALLEVAKVEGLNVKAYYSAVATAFQGFYGKYGQLAENVLGAGGYEDTPAIRNYMKIHKEVTGVDADYWGSVMYGSLLQVLEQSIETVGAIDKQAIIDHMKKNTFKTYAGEMDVRNQQMKNVWTVGQWQNGFFHAVAGEGYTNFKPVKVKDNW